MAALLGGVVALVLGFIGIIFWWGDFVQILRGSVPLVLLLGGALAAYLGFEELKDKRAVDTFEDTSTDLKQEVASLKEEIKELKKEEGTQEQEKAEENK
jgi:flagellar motor component MotA